MQMFPDPNGEQRGQKRAFVPSVPEVTYPDDFIYGKIQFSTDTFRNIEQVNITHYC
jgi:hypothetical protein